MKNCLKPSKNKIKRTKAKYNRKKVVSIGKILNKLMSSIIIRLKKNYLKLFTLRASYYIWNKSFFNIYIYLVKSTEVIFSM